MEFLNFYKSKDVWISMKNSYLVIGFFVRRLKENKPQCSVAPVIFIINIRFWMEYINFDNDNRYTENSSNQTIS